MHNQIDIPYKLKLLNSNSEVANELISFIEEQEFRNVAFITSKTPNHLLTNSLEVAIFDHVDKLKTFQVVSPSISFVNQLQLSEFDVVVGIGGGKVIDTAKYAGFVNEIPCISIPTAISNDGICSPIAVLKEKENKYKSMGAEIPIALIVPMHLIEKSSEDGILSGIGDIISNLSAIEDWELSKKETDEYVDDYAVMISKTAALTVLLEIKNSMLLKKTKDNFLKDNLKIIVESLALSGIAMEIAGTSRPASGGEHLISHSIDELFGAVKPHGIQVAFGSLITTFIRAELGMASYSAFEEMKAAFSYIGLPVTLSQLGISKQKLIEAILHAPNSRPGKYTILNKIKLDEKNIDDILTKMFAYAGAKV
jgi:glycerol-1-phosphate dehydrogenase [NAD(P)+]